MRGSFAEVPMKKDYSILGYNEGDPLFLETLAEYSISMLCEWGLGKSNCS